MKSPKTLFPRTLRRLARTYATAFLIGISLTPAGAADPVPNKSGDKPADDTVIESGPFVVTEKSLGIIPFNGFFRYSRFSQRVKTPVFVRGTMRRDQQLSEFGVKPGDQIHSVNGQELSGLTKNELIKLWMETGDAGDPLTLTVASNGPKGPAFREVKIKRISPRANSAPQIPDSPEVLAVIEKARAKQHRDETDFTEEFTTLDALIARHAGAKTEEAAQLALSRATLMILLGSDLDAALEATAQVKADYPGTQADRNADKMIGVIEREKNKHEAPAVRALIGQPAPALDFIWSTRPGLKNLTDLKGKVIVVTFWAPGSRQSVYAFQHLKFIANYYQGTPVEVVSVTSLTGRGPGPDGMPVDTRGKPDKEMGLLKKYAEQQGLTWTVAISSQPAMNPNYALQQIPSLTIIAPDGTLRENGLNPMMPLRIKIDPLLREFDLPTPTAGLAAETK
jgi:hypothetical protein